MSDLVIISSHTTRSCGPVMLVESTSTFKPNFILSCNNNRIQINLTLPTKCTAKTLNPDKDLATECRISHYKHHKPSWGFGSTWLPSTVIGGRRQIFPLWTALKCSVTFMGKNGKVRRCNFRHDLQTLFIGYSLFPTTNPTGKQWQTPSNS